MNGAQILNALFIAISLMNRGLSIALLMHFLKENLNYSAYLLFLSQAYFILANLYLGFQILFRMQKKFSFQLELIVLLPKKIQASILDVVKQQADYKIQIFFRFLDNFIIHYTLIYLKYDQLTLCSLIFNTFTIFILIHLQYNSTISFKVCIVNIIINACLFHLIIGYLFLLKSLTIVCVIISLFIVGLSKQLSCSFLSLGYPNDTIDKKMYTYLPYRLIVYLMGVRLRKFYSSNDLNDPNHFYNMISGLQVIYTISLAIADLYFQVEIVDNRFRIFLHSCFFFLFYYFWIVLSQFFTIIRFGPYKRRIKICCQKIKNLSLEEIWQNYFKFKKLQNLIILEILNYAPDQFERILPSILEQLKENKTIKLFVEENKQMHSSIQTFDNLIVSLLLNKQSLVKVLIRSLANYDFNYKYFDISQNFLQFKCILEECIENYRIIPNIISETLIINSRVYYQVQSGYSLQCKNLRSFKVEVMKILVFNEQIKSIMEFQPQQIYYDLLDSN